MITLSRGKRPWRVDVRRRADLLRSQTLSAAQVSGCTVDGTTVTGGDARVARLANEVVALADHAQQCAEGANTPLDWLTGAVIEDAWTALHDGERRLMLFEPEAVVRGRLPLVRHVTRRRLPRGDEQRAAVEARIKALRKPREALTDADRTLFASALEGAHLRSDLGYRRVRSLRNTQFGFAAVFLVVALALVGAGLTGSRALSLCVGEGAARACPTRDRIAAPSASASASPSASPSAPVIGVPAAATPASASPTGGDVPLVAFMGLLGAAIAAARAVTGTRRPAAPYSLLVAQSLLKATLGAVLAVVGVVFLRAGFVPGLDDVDSQAEILTWAFVFGYAQQLLTQVIDNRANAAAKDTSTKRDEDDADDDAGEEVTAPAR